MSDSDRDKDSITEVAEESFVRERPLEIERGSVLAGRYQVEEVIGKGGSGVVLRVFDRTVQNVVALKVLKSELARDAKWDKRFSRELRLGRPIQHPNVCRIFDIGEADGHRFLTMELATGGSLRDELKRVPALDRPIADRLADARAAIEGLAAIHATGVVHRDFKPDNLLRMEDGRLVISDFGLATDVAAGPGVTVMIGTPHYMAPEVLAGEPATMRSDVWALGVVLHEITFGRRPERKHVSFEGGEANQVTPQTLLERRLLTLCQVCLADLPVNRPATGGAVLGELNRIVAGSTGEPRRPWRVGLAALVLLAGGLAVTGLLLSRRNRVIRTTAVRQLQERGTVRDLSTAARVVAELPDHVHCLSLIDSETARVIWGAPRRAEDINLSTRARKPADLVPEAYRVGCPQLSPDGSLLFVASNPGGGREIRLSSSRDGRSAATLTTGSEPLWIKGGEQFVYEVDSYHAAVFSIPNRTFNLLADPDLSRGYVIRDKAVSTTGERILVLYSNVEENALVVYGGRLFEDRKNVFLAGAFHIRFGIGDREAFVLGNLRKRFIGLVAVGIDSAVYRMIGNVDGWDLSAIEVGSNGLALIGRALAENAWTVGEGSARQLTADGNSHSAALSASGELLSSRMGDDGRLNIWSLVPGSPAKKLTDGVYDVEPSFDPASGSWAYADYERRSVIFCEKGVGCRALVSDELVPTWPIFSADGRLLIYMTQLKTTQFTVVSIPTAQRRSTWDATDLCPPSWDAEGCVWTVEASSDGRGYEWVQHDPTSGRRTGRAIRARARGAFSDDLECVLPEHLGDSRPAVEIRRVESSRLLWVDPASLR